MLEGSLWMCLLKATAEHDSSCLTGCEFSREPILLTFALGIHQSERRVHCRQKNAWHAVAASTTKYA